MATTLKVMSLLNYNGKRYECIYNYGKTNPFKLYVKWYENGWHRKKVAEYANIDSILFYLLQQKYPVASWDIR